jgi:transposase
VPHIAGIGFNSKKKTLHASQAETERVQTQRREYWPMIREIDPSNLVFVDETGVNLIMVRLYARALKGQRATGDRPNRSGTKNTTLIGAMGLRGILGAMTVVGAADGLMFRYFVEHMLVPNLWPGACVVMDNGSLHLGEAVRALIEAAGAQLMYLPPYSPDFNPIENCWSKIKAFLQSVGARTQEALDEAITDALENVTIKDIQSWFTYRCYCTELS